MRKTTTPRKLIKSPTHWQETKQLIRGHVERIVLRYDDQEQAESLVLLLDLVTNEDYDRIDRDCIAGIALQHAFQHTAAFQTAMDICLQRVSPKTELRMVAPPLRKVRTAPQQDAKTA